MGLMRGRVFTEQIPPISQVGRTGFWIESEMTAITGKSVIPPAILRVGIHSLRAHRESLQPLGRIETITSA